MTVPCEPVSHDYGDDVHVHHFPSTPLQRYSAEGGAGLENHVHPLDSLKAIAQLWLVLHYLGVILRL